MPRGASSLGELLTARRSVRGFAPTPVPRDDLDALFGAAQRAPSWCNIQPWRAWVTSPPVTASLSTAMVAAARTGLPHPELPFPLDYPSPYHEHRRACGGALYGAMGVARDDKTGRYDAWLRNYAFFDAPHLAVVACDRRLMPYALIDVGVWLGWLLAEAEALGIDTCPMASVAAYPEVLRDQLGIGADLAILFGVALGRRDEAVPANSCRTTREPVAANVTFV
jgi:nitroreductase